jgi:hypothetical protein
VDNVSDAPSPKMCDGEPSVPTEVGENRKLDEFATKIGSGDENGVELGDSGMAYLSHLLTPSCWELIDVGIARRLSDKTGEPKRLRGSSEPWAGSYSGGMGHSGSMTGFLENSSNSS